MKYTILTKRMDAAVLTVNDSRDLPGFTWQIDCVHEKKYDSQLMRNCICKINKI